ncbi:hypothetical protein PN498_14320 [Oscillatoria sp. CS-180]|nr:hypothetical protein [Oscillatoria sp. CS-180]MDB9527173.1 hypothetical protein [Oscillatoria sp. CS-180]
MKRIQETDEADRRIDKRSLFHNRRVDRPNSEQYTARNDMS